MNISHQDLDKVTRVVQVLSDELDHKTPIRTALAFLRIAQALRDKGSTDITSIARTMNVALTFASRDVGALSEFGRTQQRNGLHVIETDLDDTDRRRRTIRLTDRGVEVLQKVVAALAE